MKAPVVRALLCASVSLLLTAQTAVTPPDEMSPAERESLTQALGEAGNSPVDFMRALENHIAKYPNSPKRSELERALVKSAMDLKDNPRIIRYGERVLEFQPDDLQILEQVAVARMQNGGTENAELALKHAEHFEQIVKKSEENLKSSNPRDDARRRDDHDRAAARAWILEARAHGMLGHTDQAIELARKSYQKFSSVEAAREAARWLEKAGKNEEAIQYLASAFTINGLQSANPDAEHDRAQMGELYRKVNGSEKGLGDTILKVYDRTFSELAARRERIRQMDPNAQVKEPMQYTISELSGEKLQLATLKGKVIVMDFWATWCGPCRGQHPLYEEVKKRFKGRDDVVFLSIDTDEDRSAVKPFVETNNWNHKVYFDDGLASLVQATSIPMTLIFDKKGQVFSRMNGFVPDRFVDMLTDRIREALGEKGPLQVSKQ